MKISILINLLHLQYIVFHQTYPLKPFLQRLVEKSTVEVPTTYGNQSGGLFQFIWDIPTAMGVTPRLHPLEEHSTEL